MPGFTRISEVATGLGCLLALAASGTARAEADGKNCGITLSAPNVTIAWNQNFNFQAVTVRVSKSKKPPCSVSLGFTRGGSGDYNRRMTGPNGTPLGYQLYADPSLTRILKDGAEITSLNDVLTLSLPDGANTSATVTYYVQIPSDLATQPTLKPSGAYSDSYLIHAYSDVSRPSEFVSPDATANVNITTVISKIIEISLGGAGSPFDPSQTSRVVSFGVLGSSGSAQPAQTVDLKIRSNAGYAISLSSQNGGVLKHSNSSVSTSVPYALTVNSQPVSLSQGVPVPISAGSGTTSLSGVTQTLSFVPGSGEGRMAGQYGDVITVTAAATE